MMFFLSIFYTREEFWFFLEGGDIMYHDIFFYVLVTIGLIYNVMLLHWQGGEGSDDDEEKKHPCKHHHHHHHRKDYDDEWANWQVVVC